MNTPRHERIWLQGGDMESQDDDTTWCSTPVDDDDIEYVLASKFNKALEQLKACAHDFDCPANWVSGMDSRVGKCFGEPDCSYPNIMERVR
jgi:hypothetical protein